jgi:hypothetical protein
MANPVERLADHQHGLAMRIAAGAEKAMSAVRATSPETFFQAKWKSSMPNHMFSPLPLMV